VTPQLQEPRPCNPCGRLDHQRKSSQLCPHCTLRSARTSLRADNGEVAAEITAAEVTINSGETTDLTTSTVNLSKPNFNEVKSLKNAAYEPVVDMLFPSFIPQKTIFKVFEKDYRGRVNEVPPTTENLMKSILLLFL